MSFFSILLFNSFYNFLVSCLKGLSSPKQERRSSQGVGTQVDKDVSSFNVTADISIKSTGRTEVSVYSYRKQVD